jgi:sugar phosphate isomerase/epimerase
MKVMGLGAAVLTFSEFNFFSTSSRKANIGLQLYTIRESIEKNLEDTMRKVADIGYLGIEYYPLPEKISPERAGRLFKDLGLKVLGMHLPLPVDAQRENALRLAKTFDCDRVIYPGWPQGDRYRNLEAMNRATELYNETASFLEGEGLRLGLHNHWWEFEETDGIYPFYYLLEHLDKSVFFEIDTYWAKTAGQDPAKVVADFRQRAPLLHIKDGPAVKGERMYEHVPAGEGSLDFHAIARAGGENIEWMVVEFDEYDKEIFDGIAKSYSFLTREGLALGRV